LQALQAEKAASTAKSETLVQQINTATAFNEFGEKADAQWRIRQMSQSNNLLSQASELPMH
jgi:hypothetical protein